MLGRDDRAVECGICGVAATWFLGMARMRARPVGPDLVQRATRAPLGARWSGRAELLGARRVCPLELGDVDVAGVATAIIPSDEALRVLDPTNHPWRNPATASGYQHARTQTKHQQRSESR